MPKSATTLEGLTKDGGASPKARSMEDLMLVLVWSANHPERVGEVLLLPAGSTAPFVFGRGAEEVDERYARVFLARQRPAANEPAGPIDDPFLSRQHLKIRRDGSALEIQSLGKRPLVADDEEVDLVRAGPGDLVEVKNLLLFACAVRPATLPPLRHGAAPPVRFGEADANGIVGETPAAWEMRDQIAFFAKRKGHVLVTGESGTGKELVARAIHALSSRAGKRLVARNAATLPKGLIDAELFGNAANYPNAGMPERAGLIGDADGGTLFLDEIGELPSTSRPISSASSTTAATISASASPAAAPRTSASSRPRTGAPKS